jgi:DNA-binding response OmpR family regulator
MTNRKILIIEDEAALAKALATVCERLDAETTLCASGQRGLQILKKEIFSLVILDLGLPDISGWRVLENVNQSLVRPPVLIITARGTLDNAVAARQLGAAAYLVKPLDLRELERTILDLLAEWHPFPASENSRRPEIPFAKPSSRRRLELVAE